MASGQTLDAEAPTESPRAARTKAAILTATRELLAIGGVRELTIEGVAARAGVAKTTIYRRWRSRDDLALAVLIDMVQPVVGAPALADTRSELVFFVKGAVTVLRETLMGSVMRGLVSELATDSELAQAFRSQVVALRLKEVERLVQRGIDRGDIRPDVDVILVHEMLFGPIYYRLFLSGEPLDKLLAARVVDSVLPSLAPPVTQTKG